MAKSALKASTPLPSTTLPFRMIKSKSSEFEQPMLKNNRRLLNRNPFMIGFQNNSISIWILLIVPAKISSGTNLLPDQFKSKLKVFNLWKDRRLASAPLSVDRFVSAQHSPLRLSVSEGMRSTWAILYCFCPDSYCLIIRNEFRNRD